jgi:putative transposase
LVKTQRIGEKMGTKRSVLTEGHGLPIAVIVSGANTHDVKLLTKTLDNLVVFRPLPTDESPRIFVLMPGMSVTKVMS